MVCHKKRSEKPICLLWGPAEDRKLMGEEERVGSKLIQQKSFGCVLLSINVTSSSPELFFFNYFLQFWIIFAEKNVFLF